VRGRPLRLTEGKTEEAAYSAVSLEVNLAANHDHGHWQKYQRSFLRSHSRPQSVDAVREHGHFTDILQNAEFCVGRKALMSGLRHR
jgi:hypothetical protein